MTDVAIPELGESIHVAEVQGVLVSVGDHVEAEQPLLELQTDKASVELPCPAEGVVEEITVEVGDEVEVGQVVVRLADDTEKAKAKAEPEQKPEPEPATEPATEPAAEPATTDEYDDDDEIGDPRAEPEPEPEPTPEPEPARQPTGRAAAGPAARRLAAELGLDLSDIASRVESDRITGRDVKRHAREQMLRVQRTPEGPPLPRFEDFGDVERERLGPGERAAARLLERSWRMIPHVTHHDEADVTELESARAAFDGELSVTPLVVKAVVVGLRDHPRLNSSFDSERMEIVYKRFIHIGVAVDTEHGLVVPVIRDADRKTTLQIADEIAQLATRARDRSLRPEDLRGGSFTVSNVGSIGGGWFTPIINYPEVAVLGVGRARARDRRVALPLSLSYDHRVVNGGDAARFCRLVADLLEQPLRLLANY